MAEMVTGAAGRGQPLEDAQTPVAVDAARVRLHTLVNIRWLALAGQSTALLTVRYGLGFAFDIGPAFAAVAASALLNLSLSLRFPLAKHLSDRAAALQLAFDLLQLSVLLYLTGGITNPFSLLMLVPVTISATILSRRSTAALLGLALAASLILAIWHRPLPWGGPPIVLPDIYVFGLWIALAVSMIFLTLYAARVSGDARRRALALSATQAALAREQRLSELGTLAAAAAHELGTPLGTIALAARELLADTPKDDPRHEDVLLIDSQVQRCREILKRLSQQRVADAAHPFSSQTAEALVREAARPFEETAGLDFYVHAAPQPPGSGAQPVLRRRPETVHALYNFIENAASFARTRVEIDIGWDAQGLDITIADDGPGFDPAVLRSLGEPYVTTRGGRSGGGMGLGIFIAKTLLERTGAGVSFVNRPEGGAAVQIHWPRSRLEPSLA